MSAQTVEGFYVVKAVKYAIEAYCCTRLLADNVTVQPHQLCSLNKELPAEALKNTSSMILLKGEGAM